MKGLLVIASYVYFLLAATLLPGLAAAQSGLADSVVFSANTSFNKKGKFHRKLFGENYRLEWATATKVPLIHISTFRGGLHPIKQGGGMQSISLRLEDKDGKEWVIRSVNKRTEALLPAELHNTIAQDFLDDANSAQHPYGALMIPPLAKAIGLPHTDPIIGVIAPDTAFGEFNNLFANTLCLLEAREPLGESDNTLKMIDKIFDDNDDTYKAKLFLKARMLDLLIGDWDRHEDQWRWKDKNEEEKGADKDYIPIPRDRDQAFRVTEGTIASLVPLPFILPTLQGFQPEIKRIHYSLFKSRFLNMHPANQFSKDEWMAVVHDFVEDMTDTVLEDAIRRLPKEIYAIRHEQLLKRLQQRRKEIPEAMEQYYRFINQIVDIRLSNKNEKVSISDDKDGGLRVMVQKINKDSEVTRKLMDKVYTPDMTKEIRVYLSDGNDSVLVKNTSSQIHLRLIEGRGLKNFDTQQAHSIKFYKYKPDDSLHTAFVPVNLYPVWFPLLTGGYNADDGIMLGAGFRYTGQGGFRKVPFTHIQEVSLAGSFATGAVRLKYMGQWKEAIWHKDFLVLASIRLPHTQNYFGYGNGSVYEKDVLDMRFYRARFGVIDIQPALLWHPGSNNTFSFGPALEYYHVNRNHNAGRLLDNTQLLKTYDSLSVYEDKYFAGIKADFVHDSRDSKVLPKRGFFANTQLISYTGLNGLSKSYIQVYADIAGYCQVLPGLIATDRIGGGATFGKTAFYQSFFLGGQGNLLGFRQYRFSGNQMLFNNLEARFKLADVGSYILPGELGISGFYDVGRVWTAVDASEEWHQGYGGGIYYAPAKIALFQLSAGHSKESWYPYLTMGYRF
ncbi:Surface antigen [bacterium A37T11]|nr:Surface antigen [bacterium A37T11]